MNIPILANISTIKTLLSSHSLTLKKSLGQNFLISEHVLEKIIEAADIKPGETILEIGAGIGTLTDKLAEKTDKVIAIEKDRGLIPILQKNLKNRAEIIEADALKIDPPDAPYKIIANIPYLITSPLINHFVKKRYCHCEEPQATKQSPSACSKAILNPPILLILMIQKEVAEKISAHEGKLNMLAINTQTFADVKTLFPVKAGNFYPAPKVDSAVIQIKPLKKPRVTCDLSLYFKIISAGFQSKRKNLANALSHNLNIPKETVEKWLKISHINPLSRAETLTFQQWETLTHNLPSSALSDK